MATQGDLRLSVVPTVDVHDIYCPITCAVIESDSLSLVGSELFTANDTLSTAEVCGAAESLQAQIEFEVIKYATSLLRARDGTGTEPCNMMFSCSANAKSLVCCNTS